MDESTVEQFRRDLLEWAETNLREYPWRDCGASIYEVFIAEFFLTQTPAENVGSVYPDFINEFPSLEAIRGASEDELVDSITPLGFQNLRTEALKTIAEHNDSIPRDKEALSELPRVGDYVASATVCFALDQPVPILDRNVVRIYKRLFGDQWPSSSAEQKAFASEILPKKHAREFNLALLDFGAAVCTTEPKCTECFASEYCEYAQDIRG
ncbi:HhH-GPD family protein [Salinigranum halophilum]|uniref:hypothetical protein n=1 Tax=Salinigranum halophilum TaxID=2565931 RepID=UPI0010A81765|nr:hypothetical protein [Salinigranum halophilum]